MERGFLVKYKTVLVVTGVDLAHVPTLVRLSTGLSDLVWSSVDGRVTAAVYTDESSDPVHAAAEAANRVEQVLPGARAERVDDDLVSVPMIAERAGVGREAARLWSLGKRGPGGFPTPRASLPSPGEKGPIKVWAWAEVSAWLAEHYELRDEHLSLSAAQTAELNAYLSRVDHSLAQQWQVVSAASRSAAHYVVSVQAPLRTVRGGRLTGDLPGNGSEIVETGDRWLARSPGARVPA